MREAGRCAGVTGRSDLDDRSAGAADTRVDLSIIILLLAALCYNALLAIINAHVRPLSVTQAAASEFLILAAAAGLMIARGLRPQDAAPLGLGIAFFFGSLILSIANDQPVVAMMRNVAIIVVFTMLGGRCNRATIRAVFLLSVAIVLAVMIVEMSSISTYSSIFNPFKYYKNTRGLGEDISEDIGLFSNALGFEGRFNFGVFSTPRTSSIFLEQTSLANFASFCVIYLVSLWRSTNRAERWLGISFVSLALLSNNTRTASLLTLISLAGFFIFPLLPRRGTLALPFLVLALAWMATTLMGVSHEDDLAGRVGLSLNQLSVAKFDAWLGLRALDAYRFPDSGYCYVLYGSSIFGAIVLWLYITLVIPFHTVEQRRCAWATGLFFFANLMIGGNAVFSIKVAAAIWLLAGFMRREEGDGQVGQTMPQGRVPPAVRPVALG